MREVYLILPGQNFDSLPLDLASSECRDILNAWTVQYHPEILTRTRCSAKYIFLNDVMEDPQDAVLLVPEMCSLILPDYWILNAQQQGCILLNDLSDRFSLLQKILSLLDSSDLTADNTTRVLSQPDENQLSSAIPSQDSFSPLPEDNDFYALGLAHFMSEVLSWRTRFMSNLDRQLFQNVLITAAEEKKAGNAPISHQAMQDAWDQVAQSLQYDYPSQLPILDLTLMTPEMLNAEILSDLLNEKNVNLLTDTETFSVMENQFPELFKKLKEALDQGELSILSGEQTETRTALLDHEGVRARLLHGLTLYEKLFHQHPTLYGRRTYGLTALMPTILNGLGYEAALHATLDDGRFPVPPNQPRSRWFSPDGIFLEAFTTIPLDASSDTCIFTLLEKISDRSSTDNTSGVILAHWIGDMAPSVCDLKRSMNWAPVAGEFQTFSSWLEQSRYSAPDEIFHPDEYRSPYLEQSVAHGEKDPISVWTQYYKRRAKLEDLASLEGFLTWLTPQENESKNHVVPSELPDIISAQNWLDRLDSMPDQLPETQDAQIEQRKKTLLTQILQAFGATPEEEKSISASPVTHALFLFNPQSFSRRTTISLDKTDIFPLKKLPVLDHLWQRKNQATSDSEISRAVVVETPPFGYAAIKHNPDEPTTYPESQKSLGWKLGHMIGLGGLLSPKQSPMNACQDPDSGMWILRNEYMEIMFDTHTGHLRSVYDYTNRRNRLSQSLALRLKPQSMTDYYEGDDSTQYSIMAADEITASSSASGGEIKVRGRLINREDGSIAAFFTQETRLLRGSRILELDITLDPQYQLGPRPWQSYFTCRWAWADSAVHLRRNLGFHAVTSNLNRLEAPLFLDIRPVESSVQELVNTVNVNLKKSISHFGVKSTEEPRKIKMEKEKSHALEQFTEKKTSCSWMDTPSCASVTILTGGLPFHRRTGLRKLDSLLMVQGETARNFRLGMALDHDYPVLAARDFLAPMQAIPCSFTSDTHSHAWLARMNRSNVICTHWENTPDGAVFRLGEIEGRDVTVTMEFFRNLKAARETNFLDVVLSVLDIKVNSLTLPLKSWAWTQIHIYWE